MSRLASLTPSRPTSRSSLSPSPSPSSPSRATETTYHRMLKLLLAEVRNLIKTWDELVMIDGLKAGRSCVDEATQMDNILQTEDVPERPPIGPHLETLRAGRASMETLLSKLEKLVTKLSLLIDQAEKIFFEAYEKQGPDFCLSEPMWLTWTFERFVNSVSPLLTLHNRHLCHLSSISLTICSSATSFDDAKLALEHWQDLSRAGERWEAVREWEELVELELAGSDGEMEVEVEENVKARRKSRKK